MVEGGRKGTESKPGHCHYNRDRHKNGRGKRNDLSKTRFSFNRIGTCAYEFDICILCTCLGLAAKCTYVFNLVKAGLHPAVHPSQVRPSFLPALSLRLPEFASREGMSICLEHIFVYRHRFDLIPYIHMPSACISVSE